MLSFCIQFSFQLKLNWIELKWRWEMPKNNNNIEQNISYLFKRLLSHLKNLPVEKRDRMWWGTLIETNSKGYKHADAFNWHIILECIITIMLNVHRTMVRIVHQSSIYHAYTGWHKIAGDLCNFQWALFLLLLFNFFTSVSSYLIAFKAIRNWTHTHIYTHTNAPNSKRSQ